MAFLPNIPQATDQIATSQADILNNFSILGAIAGNSSASSASINSIAGFDWILLPPNGAIPPSGSAFITNNLGLYGATNTLTTHTELYLNKTVTTLSGTTIQQIATTAASLSAGGWSYLPSGVLIKWGSATAPGAGPYILTFPVNGSTPQFNHPYIPLLTNISPITTYVTALTATTMTVQCSGAGSFYWFVIGD